MIHWINILIGNKLKKSFQPSTYKSLPDWLYQQFKSKGEGLFYSCIRSKDNDTASKAISSIAKFFNKPGKEDLPLSHCIAILYSENLKSHFTGEDWSIIQGNWNNYYGGTKLLDDSVKTLVLASADSTGMNYFDFSKYQTRDFSLRKVDLIAPQESKALHFLAAIAPKYYDYTGLVFWWLYKICIWFKFLDDPEALYCSENIYEAFMCADFKIAAKEEPSPLDIENYNLDLRFFVTPGFLKK